MTDTLPTVLAARCPRCERLVQINLIVENASHHPWLVGICEHVWTRRDGLALKAAS